MEKEIQAMHACKANKKTAAKMQLQLEEEIKVVKSNPSRKEIVAV